MDDEKEKEYQRGYNAFNSSLGVNVFRVADALHEAAKANEGITWIFGWLAAQAEERASE